LSQAIQAQEGTTTPPHVQCPASEPVRDAYTFTCVLIRGGQKRSVLVTETSDQGRFTWKLVPAPPTSPPGQ
jgi:hypothetical protein